MAEKRFYWLKLQCDFFQQKEMKKLRKIAGGATYTIVYLKMQLLSLKNEGVVVFESVEDSIEEELALVLDESAEDVQMTLLFLKKHGLIEELSEAEYLLPKAVESMGRESASAERVRRLRERKAILQGNEMPLHGNATVTACNDDVTQRKRIETEIDSEKDILPGARTAPGPQESPVIEILLNDGSMYPVFSPDINRWTELYPAVDIVAQLRKMAGWSESNARQRKTKSGVKRFINGWLSREQDRGGNKLNRHPHGADGTAHPDGGIWMNGQQVLGVAPK